MINRQCLPLQLSVDRCGNWVDFHGTLCYDGGVGPKCHQSLVLRVRRHKTQIEAQWKKVKKNYVSLLPASFQKHYLPRGRIVLSTLHRPLWLDLSFVVNHGHAWFANGSWKKREKRKLSEKFFHEAHISAVGNRNYIGQKYYHLCTIVLQLNLQTRRAFCYHKFALDARIFEEVAAQLARSKICMMCFFQRNMLRSPLTPNLFQYQKVSFEQSSIEKIKKFNRTDCGQQIAMALLSQKRGYFFAQQRSRACNVKKQD